MSHEQNNPAIDRCDGSNLRADLESGSGGFAHRSLLIASYCMYSAGLPVSRSIRFATGGCVENKPANMPAFMPRNG